MQLLSCVYVILQAGGERGGAEGATTAPGGAGDAASAAVSHHSQARAVLEAAVTSSMSHPNVVATLHVRCNLWLVLNKPQPVLQTTAPCPMNS